MIGFIKTRLGSLSQWCAHHSYLFILIFLYQGDRHLSHYLYIVSAAICMDLLLQRWVGRKPHLNISVWITCSTCYMLMVTKHLLWPYFVAVGFGILSKYIFTVRGRHIFNPGNFGLLLAMCAFSDVAMMSAGQWLGSKEMMIFFACFGITVSIIANRWVLSLTYISVFFLLRLIKFGITDISLFYLIGPIFSVSGFIFAFHMSTDPKTSPESRKGQLLFALIVALFDFAFREAQIIFASVLALTLVCAIRAIFLEYGNEKLKRLIEETTFAR